MRVRRNSLVSMGALQQLACTLSLASVLSCQAHTPDSPGGATPNEQMNAATDTDPLPGSLKGYELYAWQEGGTLSFTLITGTNRQKTLEEITASTPNTSTGDWIFVRGQGSEALHDLLDRVPAETSVVLMELQGLAPLSEAKRAEITGAIESR